MLFTQPLHCLIRQIQRQRQIAAVKLEHIHTQPEWGQILFALIAQLAQGQFANSAIMKHLGLMPHFSVVLHRSHAIWHHWPAPQFRPPGPIRLQRGLNGISPDQRQHQAAIGDMDQLIHRPFQITRPAAQTAQRLKVEITRKGGISLPTPQRPPLGDFVDQSVDPVPHRRFARLVICLLPSSTIAILF